MKMQRSLQHTNGIKTIGMLAVAVAVFSLSSEAASSRFSDNELKILNAGGTVRRIFPESGNKGFYGGSGWTVVNASQEEVWAAIQDWGSYTNAFPNTIEAKEISRKPGRSLLRMRLGHPVIQVIYHVEMRPDLEKKTIAFSMVKNHQQDLDEIDGYWQLFPLAEKRTLVAYVVRVQVPMGIVNILSESFKKMALHGILGAPGHLKKWIEEKAPGRYRKKAK